MSELPRAPLPSTRPAIKKRRTNSLLVSVATPNSKPTPRDDSFWEAVKELSASITKIDPNPANTAGSFGDVYIGRHREHGRVALKQPRVSPTNYTAKALQTFLREAMRWRDLNHEHLLRFVGICRRGDQLYLVSPWMDNGSINQFVLRHPEADRVDLLSRTADALHWLHTNGVTHGDIKGANVLISRDGTPRLCDFGLSKLQTLQDSKSDMAPHSVRWQSPQLLDGGNKDFRGDVWAFGMLLYEVLSGRPPYFEYELEEEALDAIRAGRLPPTEPMFAITGETYYRAWRAARHCWIRNASIRPEITKIVTMMQGSSNGQVEDVAVYADQLTSIPEHVSASPSDEVYLKSDGEDNSEVSPCYCDWDEEKECTTCANELCELRWFHLECIGLKSTPDGWYCMACEVQRLEGHLS